jgi:WD40 repeat protein
MSLSSIGPSAANACLPPDSAVIMSAPPMPQATRGIRCSLDGGSNNKQQQPRLSYGSGKSVVTRTLDDSVLLPSASSSLSSLVYRHHPSNNVTTCKTSPSGAYMCSGDDKGHIKIWALDHPEHLLKYEASPMNGPIRDVAWDADSQRLVIGGERSDARSQCAVVIQKDGVSAGLLAQFQKGRVAAVAFRPTRPMRIVTAGMDEPLLHFHQGPPFQKVPPQQGVPCEDAHIKGGVHCVRYNSDGSLVVSVGTDRSIVVYDGATLEFKTKLSDAHVATIYSVAWSADDKHILTASGDGTCKLFAVTNNTAADGGAISLQQVHVWNVAEHEAAGMTFEKVPIGGTQMGCTFVQGNSNTPVSVGLNGQLSILPMPSGTMTAAAAAAKIQTWTGHYAPIAGLAVDEDAGYFYTGDTNGILCQWDLATTKCIQRLEPPQGNFDLMHVVPSVDWQ